ncbi:MAG: hypothetical protein IJZ63_03065 [Clostridia bacterium]|nr:hypothetical protein [Clostridia bacterium]
MKLKLKDVAVLSLMGALMFAGDVLLEMLPNIHLVGIFITVTTAVYRKWALLSIYVYVLLQGLLSGFDLWWIPYIYIWDFLWLFIMLIPKRLPDNIKNILYVVVCALHGYLFGILYAPSQVLLFFDGDFSRMIPWIILGIPADIIHGTSNLILGTLFILPAVKILKLTNKYAK